MTRIGGNIEIIAVGKLRTRHWSAAQQDYLKRISRYMGIRISEVKDFVGAGLSDDQAVHREAALLLKAIPEASYRLALSPDGEPCDSKGFAELVRHRLETHSRLAFVVGGPVGLAGEVAGACDQVLSFSRQTFPHELFRIMLLEQLYRAATLISGEDYHK